MNILLLLYAFLYDAIKREDLCLLEGQVSKCELDHWMIGDHPPVEGC